MGQAHACRVRLHGRTRRTEEEASTASQKRGARTRGLSPRCPPGRNSECPGEIPRYATETAAGVRRKGLDQKHDGAKWRELRHEPMRTRIRPSRPCSAVVLNDKRCGSRCPLHDRIEVRRSRCEHRGGERSSSCEKRVVGAGATVRRGDAVSVPRHSDAWGSFLSGVVQAALAHAFHLHVTIRVRAQHEASADGQARREKKDKAQQRLNGYVRTFVDAVENAMLHSDAWSIKTSYHNNVPPRCKSRSRIGCP